MAPMLHARSENFDERNPLACLVLGLLSLSGRLDALLTAHAGEPGDADASAHPWDDAVLGLIAVRARLLEHLEAGCPEPEAPAAAPRSTGGGRPREVMR